MLGASPDNSTQRRTPLYALHQEHGAKMVPFAGYEMPVNYPDGILKEHLHTRTNAGLFDVSHMGQMNLRGADMASAAAALESLIPADYLSLPKGRQKYGLLTNAQGGIRDDLMVQNLGDRFGLVINAAEKEDDFEYLQEQLGGNYQLDFAEDLALLALQGPAAAAVLANLGHDLADMKFMDVRELVIDAGDADGGIACTVSRSGYSGEDGFEISLPAAQSQALARRLLKEPAVKLIGLGARDSLRLEAGLCLYGHDITSTTTPIEAGLNWAISPARRSTGARAGGFPGADIILPQMSGAKDMPAKATPATKLLRRRVGLLPEGRAPVREGAELLDAAGDSIGVVTSGGFSPSLGHPISMGYVSVAHAEPGSRLQAMVRGKPLPVTVAPLPFVSTNFYR